MTPKTAELIREIESAREQTQHILEDADEDVRESGEVSEQVSRDLKESDAEGTEAVEILRRAGLLPA